MNFDTFQIGLITCLIMGWIFEAINNYLSLRSKKKKKYARLLVKCWVYNTGGITFRNKSQINPEYAHTLHNLSTEAEFDVEIIGEVDGRVFVSSVDYRGERVQKFPTKVGGYSNYEHIPRNNILSSKELIFNKQGTLIESN